MTATTSAAFGMAPDVEPHRPDSSLDRRCDHHAHGVTGGPRWILRADGAILCVAALAGFVIGLDVSLWLIPLLLLVPDVFMAGYAKSNRAGAALYNLAHSYPAPAIVGALASLAHQPPWQGVALIWFAHVGMDRALGYGLKYGTGFRDTHLGRIGRGGPATSELV
jgi:hypothetical protein